MYCTVYRLTVLTFVLGALSVVLYILAVSTDSWLVTHEVIENTDNMTGTVVLIPITTWGGLWRICISPDMFPNEISCQVVSLEVDTGTDVRKQSGTSTTTNIVTNARKSAVLVVSALVIAVAAVTVSAVGNIRKDAKTLMGGVCYVLSGLSLAVGLILYISTINDEVGYRIGTKKKEYGFSYDYGWSFFTAGSAFLVSELAAVICITLYLRRNANVEDMTRIIPGLEDKVSFDVRETKHLCGLQNPSVVA